MITLYADYHTHTIYSHGKGTIMDNVMAAKARGLKEIAITDHGLRHFSFGVKKRHVAKMREEIDRINSIVDGVKVLLGMECNIISLDGHIDIDEETRKYLDILLVGFHMMVIPRTLSDAYNIYGRHYLSKAFKGMAERAKERNTEAVIAALGKNKIDIITHPGARIPIDTTSLAKEAAKVGTVLEINAHSSFLDAYYVKEAAKQGAKFVINSDAHRPEDVGNFAKGIKIAEEAGLTSEQIINAVK